MIDYLFYFFNGDTFKYQRTIQADTYAQAWKQAWDEANDDNRYLNLTPRNIS